MISGPDDIGLLGEHLPLIVGAVGPAHLVDAVDGFGLLLEEFFESLSNALIDLIGLCRQVIGHLPQNIVDSSLNFLADLLHECYILIIVSGLHLLGGICSFLEPGIDRILVSVSLPEITESILDFLTDALFVRVIIVRLIRVSIAFGVFTVVIIVRPIRVSITFVVCAVVIIVRPLAKFGGILLVDDLLLAKGA